MSYKSRQHMTANDWHERLATFRATLRSVKSLESPDPQTVLALKRYVEWLRAKALQAMAREEAARRV